MVKWGGGGGGGKLITLDFNSGNEVIIPSGEDLAFDDLND